MNPGTPKDNSGQLYAQQAAQQQALQQQQWVQEQQAARANEQAQLAQKAQEQAALEASNKLAEQKEAQEKLIQQQQQAAATAATPYLNSGTATGLKAINAAPNLVGEAPVGGLPGFNAVANKAKQGNSLAATSVKLGG